MTSEIVNRQREFFLTGKTLDVKYRKDALCALRQGILDMEDEINAALKSDLGKSPFESYMCEVGMTLSEIGHTVRNIGKYARKRRVRTPLAQFPARSYIIPEPYGNVLIMSPWNYPFLLCLSPLVSAIAAGNTAIVKPSAYSPATSAVIRKLVAKVFPEELATVIEGGRDVNSDLLEQKFDYIFFTGSKEVGKIVMKKAAEHLTPVTLELGGKSPVIVGSSADIGMAARRIVFGKFLNCGQTCVAPDYVLVNETIADKFLNECKKITREMFGKDVFSNKDYGRIVNRKHYDRLMGTIGDAMAHGCAIVYGGRGKEETLQIEPTIIWLGRTSSISRVIPVIMQDEIFGPVLPVLTWLDEDEVIEFISSRPKPLATYIFTRNKRFRKKMLSRLHFGGGCVNDTIIHLATEEMPFGGVGESGMGNYHGKFGFDTFSHMKSIVDKPFHPDLPMRYQPYTSLHGKIVRKFMK